MWRFFAFVLTFVFLAASGVAGERPEGLLWNRSGLAATLPLQVKTDPGTDYLLRLRDVETGRDVLAAYIRGGEFFRVLVPPGRYRLVFAAGTEWQGEAALFGPETRRFVLDPPLSFGATVSRREGHLVDLRGGMTASVSGLAFCQRLALDVDSLRRPEQEARKTLARPAPARLPPSPYPMPRYDVQSRVCD